MKHFIKGLLGVLLKNRTGYNLLNNAASRTTQYLKTLSYNRAGSALADSSLYRTFAEYTRLPEELFCSNLRLVREHVTQTGSVVECGVWRGGMTAAMACILGSDREYYLFDSFEGLPEATERDGIKALEWQKNNDLDNCATEEFYAVEAMKRSGANDYKVIKGWFRDTLPKFRPRDRIAVLRLDADWYSSTADCLNHLYGQVVPGGLIIIDDYYTWDGCSRAVHDFLSANNLADRIEMHESTICFIRKTNDGPVVTINPEPADQAKSLSG